MSYRIQSRLRHASNRFAAVNKENAVYEGKRDGVTYKFPIEVSPILMSADELSAGNASATRVEYQDFGIDRHWLKNLYPPEIGDKVTLSETGEIFNATSMGIDEPPYQHVTSSRDRVIVHTIRKGSGY